MIESFLRAKPDATLEEFRAVFHIQPATMTWNTIELLKSGGPRRVIRHYRILAYSTAGKAQRRLEDLDLDNAIIWSAIETRQKAIKVLADRLSTSEDRVLSVLVENGWRIRQSEKGKVNSWIG
ncbi:hypothetical protein FRB96_005521 [Tulasnella sp. 330]|nr:hypothetical protein FRB96_005521 [Tulasnella sp. 330]